MSYSSLFLLSLLGSAVHEANSLAVNTTSDSLDCGGVDVCGVLVLQSVSILSYGILN